MAEVIRDVENEEVTAADALIRRLEEKGYIVKRKSGSVRHEPVPDFKPIPNKGKPASEIIIEGRG